MTPSGQAVYEQIFVFSHRAQKEAAVFTSLTSESGHKLSATPGHYIWAAKPGQKASIVRMGDIEVSLQAQGHGCEFVLVQLLDTVQGWQLADRTVNIVLRVCS